MVNCAVQDVDMVTTAFGVALIWGLFLGARIPIALLAMIVGLMISGVLVIVLYSVGIVPAALNVEPDVPDLTGWCPRLLSGIATFVILGLFHVWRQRWEGRSGW